MTPSTTQGRGTLPGTCRDLLRRTATCFRALPHAEERHARCSTHRPAAGYREALICPTTCRGTPIFCFPALDLEQCAVDCWGTPCPAVGRFMDCRSHGMLQCTVPCCSAALSETHQVTDLTRPQWRGSNQSGWRRSWTGKRNFHTLSYTRKRLVLH